MLSNEVIIYKKNDSTLNAFNVIIIKYENVFTNLKSIVDISKKIMNIDFVKIEHYNQALKDLFFKL